MASHVAGILGISDSEHTYVNKVGQSVVYDAVNQVLEMWNNELAAMMSMFVEKTTTDFEVKYKFIQGGRLQKQGTLAPAGAGMTEGAWTVGFPLFQFGDAIGYDRVGIAYLNIAEVDRHIKAVRGRALNTLRWEILHRLLDNVQLSHDDTDLSGKSALLIEPLANGDTVVYPPLMGTEAGATEDHYLESGYAASAISDTNNPIATMVADLSQHFGEAEDQNIITFINPAQRAKVEALSNFVEIEDRFIQQGADTAQLIGLPEGARIPGKIIGRTDDSWVSKWDWMPANYMFSLSLDQEAPLWMRVDPADTGLPQGLQLISEHEHTPFHDAQYAYRMGLGTAQRLNGVAMELGIGGTYTVPTAYD